jgi:S1-C subfamily serine protease
MHVLDVMTARVATGALACFLLIAGAPAHAATLNPKLLPNVEAATFEVVAAKPPKTLSYAEPLPLDLLPYQQRTDKYHSIGTAFAIGKGRYVTAGHVLLTGLNSLWGPPALRDNKGHVYAINKIEKFSYERDFVVFTVKGTPGKAALKINTHPALNQTVYAVGNALGTGIVIRDGLYTSNTPEQQNGRWKWLRFSAAASPGNSGGPLLDANGKVIGVVLMKSANENLNYALPIAQVLDAPDHLAEADKRISYGFDVFDDSLNNVFKTNFALPKSLDDFFAAFGKRLHAYEDSQLKALLAKDPAHLFPHGEGSEKLLHGIASSSTVPHLITRNSNGQWTLTPHKFHKMRLADNGYLALGGYKHDIVFRLRRPDSVSANAMFEHPKKLMDLLLKAGLFHRTIGSDRIKVTSFGKPALATNHVDKWQRRWRIFQWAIPFGNGMLTVAALPVPDGYVGILSPGKATDQHDYLINTQALTDFIYANYGGSLAQWKSFLAQPERLPAQFGHIDIGIDYDDRFAFASKPLRFTITPEVQPIKAKSKLNLAMTFFKDQGKVVWNVGAIRLAPRAHDGDMIGIIRNEAPSASMNDSYKANWAKLLNRRHPYDAVAFTSDDRTKIRTVVGAPASAKPDTLYTVYYDVEGSKPQSKVKAKLDLVLKNLKVKDSVRPSTAQR